MLPTCNSSSTYQISIEGPCDAQIRGAHAALCNFLSVAVAFRLADGSVNLHHHNAQRQDETLTSGTQPFCAVTWPQAWKSLWLILFIDRANRGFISKSIPVVI